MIPLTFKDYLFHFSCTLQVFFKLSFQEMLDWITKYKYEFHDSGYRHRVVSINFKFHFAIITLYLNQC